MIDGKTIEAALALPLDAREALRDKAEGPGWYIQSDADGRYMARLWPELASTLPMEERDAARMVTARNAWVPCSEAEVLRVWAGIVRDGSYVVDEDQAILYERARHWSAPHDDTLNGRLRAALECCPLAGGDDAQ